jgi:hypothetical protein
MRCADARLALDAASGRTTPELAEHLGACAACARWAVDRRLDLAWAATRPADPAPLAFDRVWTSVLAAEARSPSTIPNHAASLHRRGWAALGVVAAAAAAVLVAATAWIRMRAADQAPPQAPVVATVVPAVFEAEHGETLFIHIAGRSATAQSQPPAEVSDTVTVAAEIDILNFMESQSGDAL